MVLHILLAYSFLLAIFLFLSIFALITVYTHKWLFTTIQANWLHLLCNWHFFTNGCVPTTIHVNWLPLLCKWVPTVIHINRLHLLCGSNHLHLWPFCTSSFIPSIIYLHCIGCVSNEGANLLCGWPFCTDHEWVQTTSCKSGVFAE